MREKIEWFKKTIHDSMLENYKRDGRLTPVFITFTNEEILITPIPSDLLKPKYKLILAEIIKETCKNPLILASVVILEAYGAQVEPDSEVVKLLKKGEIDMSDIEDKRDIIIMFFSCPEEEEFIAYYVDDKTKTVGNKFCENGGNYEGLFSHLFTWNKN